MSDDRLLGSSQRNRWLDRDHSMIEDFSDKRFLLEKSSIICCVTTTTDMTTTSQSFHSFCSGGHGPGVTRRQMTTMDYSQENVDNE
jgi:hypothetical protein